MLTWRSRDGVMFGKMVTFKTALGKHMECIMDTNECFRVKTAGNLGTGWKCYLIWIGKRKRVYMTCRNVVTIKAKLFPMIQIIANIANPKITISIRLKILPVVISPYDVEQKRSSRLPKKEKQALMASWYVLHCITYSYYYVTTK